MYFISLILTICRTELIKAALVDFSISLNNTIILSGNLVWNFTAILDSFISSSSCPHQSPSTVNCSKRIFCSFFTVFIAVQIFKNLDHHYSFPPGHYCWLLFLIINNVSTVLVHFISPKLCLLSAQNLPWYLPDM